VTREIVKDCVRARHMRVNSVDSGGWGNQLPGADSPYWRRVNDTMLKEATCGRMTKPRSRSGWGLFS